MKTENHINADIEHPSTINETDALANVLQFKAWFREHHHAISPHKRLIFQVIFNSFCANDCRDQQSLEAHYYLSSNIINNRNLSDVLFLHKTLALLDEADQTHLERQNAIRNKPNQAVRASFTNCSLSTDLRPIIKDQQTIIMQEIARPFVAMLCAYAIRDIFLEPLETSSTTVPLYAMLSLVAVALLFAHERSFKRLPKAIDLSHRFVAALTPFCAASYDEHAIHTGNKQLNNAHSSRS